MWYVVVAVLATNHLDPAIVPASTYIVPLVARRRLSCCSGSYTNTIQRDGSVSDLGYPEPGDEYEGDRNHRPIYIF